MRLQLPPPRLIIIALVGCLSYAVDALIHEQVAFDSFNVCWWSLTPPDPVCPVLRQQNLTDIVNSLKSSNNWQGGTHCEGPYCLYANRAFASGRGIVVITDPDSLAKVKQVGDLLQEYDISFADDSPNVPFHTTHVDGKGEAVVASNAMKRGDPIMAHTPVLLVHQTFRKDAPRERQQQLLKMAVDALPATTAEKLKDCGSIDMVLSAQSSFEVNWEASDDKAHAHDGVFPEAATITHDCRPNTAYYVDPATLMHITTAAQPIRPGEHLTLSRLDPFATREERQAQAHAKWGSRCTCSQCSLSAAEAADSETRLREIQWIEAKLRDPASPEVSSTGLVTYHLGLHENERLHCCLARAYALAAENLNMLGHDKHAVKYADLAIEAFKMEKGEGVPEIREMEEVRSNPKGHATWKQRLKAKKAQSALGLNAMTPAAAWAEPTKPAVYQK